MFSASSYGNVTAADSFWSQCHIFRFENTSTQRARWYNTKPNIFWCSDHRLPEKHSLCNNLVRYNTTIITITWSWWHGERGSDKNSIPAIIRDMLGAGKQKKHCALPGVAALGSAVLGFESPENQPACRGPDASRLTTTPWRKLIL